MYYICPSLGYCGSCIGGDRRHVTDRIPKEGLVTADQFLEWVLWAEGGNPDLTPKQHRKNIRGAFVGIMGGEVVDARRLRQW